MANPFLGQIATFPYDFAPQGWADCQGQLLSITQNAALFSLIGTRFGGDGVRNFALPDLQGRVAVGQGTIVAGGTYHMGDTGGVQTVALTANDLAPHSHPLQATTALGTTNAPAGAVLSTAGKGPPTARDKGQIYNTGTVNTTLVPASITSLGGHNAHDNIQPLLTLRYCIALSGLFPPRQ
jgi:microcystin-dependent protein